MIEEKIIGYDTAHFHDLLHILSDDEIETINTNTNYVREDFCDDFSFKFMVVRDYIKGWLIMNLECNENLEETKKLFELYCQAG